MTDETLLVEGADQAAPDAPDAPAPDIVDKLEKILSAVGYELPVLWDEAVALARKTI